MTVHSNGEPHSSLLDRFDRNVILMTFDVTLGNKQRSSQFVLRTHSKFESVPGASRK